LKSNRYHITQKIAQGGSAEVFRAIFKNNMGWKRTVAIKKILAKHVGNPSQEAMIITEAKLLVSLNHPNIVKVYDLGCMKGAYFFVMEYVDGCDLRRVMQWFYDRKERIPIDCAVMVVCEVCKALDYAHQKTDPNDLPLNLVHQDISPKNILISKAGEVKLSDFGIAKLHLRPNQGVRSRSEQDRRPTHRSDRAVVRGKFAYMSPEQAHGEVLDARSDIFSLGLILYELLTGRRYFKSKKLADLQKEHQHYPIQAPLFPEHISEELEFIVLQCLSHVAKNRYPHAGALCQDLVRFLYHSLNTIPHQQLAFIMEEILPPKGPVVVTDLWPGRPRIAQQEIPTLTAIVPRPQKRPSSAAWLALSRT